jgi:hypothetical protein
MAGTSPPPRDNKPQNLRVFSIAAIPPILVSTVLRAAMQHIGAEVGP